MSRLSSTQKKLRQIEEANVGATGLPVVLTEGAEDREFFTILLDRWKPGWSSHFVLADVGGKSLVCDLLRERPSWFGIVDRDEWAPEEVDRASEELPNLRVLPRYCLESYLIVPEEIWQALEAAGLEEVATLDLQSFKDPFLEPLPRYVRHWALWKVVTPLWQGLRGLGFKEDLASEDSVAIAQDDDQIWAKLETWHNKLTPGPIFDRFQQERQRAERLEPSDRLKQAVHGKVYWEQIVHLQLNRLFRQGPRESWRRVITRNLVLPEDLAQLLASLPSAND